MKTLPRAIWVTGGVGLALLLSIFLTTRPRGKTPASSAARPSVEDQRLTPSRSAAYSTRNESVARQSVVASMIEYRERMPVPRFLRSYDRLRRRNIFRSAIAPNSSTTGDIRLIEPDLGAPLGIPPIGVTGFPRFDDPLVALPNVKGPFTAQKLLGAWAYVGYSTLDGHPHALLQNKTSRQGRIVRAGDTVEEAVVLNVTRQGIRFVKAGNGLFIPLTSGVEGSESKPKGGEAKGAETKPATPTPPGPGSPGGASPPMPPGAPVNPGAPPTKEMMMSVPTQRMEGNAVAPKEGSSGAVMIIK